MGFHFKAACVSEETVTQEPSSKVLNIFKAKACVGRHPPELDATLCNPFYMLVFIVCFIQ